jgi:hypothetical protein
MSYYFFSWPYFLGVNIFLLLQASSFLVFFVTLQLHRHYVLSKKPEVNKQ